MGAGAAVAPMALSASATDRSIDVTVRCNGAWTGSLQWSLDGDDLGGPVDISCPDGSSRSNFKLSGITLALTGSAHANDFHISAAGFSGIGDSTEAECEFAREFDPDDLATLRSTYACGNNGGKGDDASLDVRTR